MTIETQTGYTREIELFVVISTVTSFMVTIDARLNEYTYRIGITILAKT